MAIDPAMASISEPKIGYRQPPIVGGDACMLLDGGFLTVPTNEMPATDIAAIGVDLQPHQWGRQVVLGNRGLTVSWDVGESEPIRFLARDDSGGVFEATVTGSGALGIRLMIQWNALSGRFEAWEMQPWGRNSPCVVNIVRGDALEFNPLFGSATVLGASWNEGTPAGSYRGRAANFVMFDRWLDEAVLSEMKATSAADAEPFGPPKAGVDSAPSRELSALFLDDLEVLRAAAASPNLSDREMRNVASIIYRWMFDRHPMLPKIGNALGIQISYPDLRPVGRRSGEAIRALKPALYVVNESWAEKWVPLSVLRSDTTFWLPESEREVHWEVLVRFVRDKMGGGHFDEDERKKWHSELADLSRSITVSGVTPWLNHKMRILAWALAFTASAHGLDELLQRFAAPAP